MAAKKPLQDPAVPDGAVDGINPADADAYKGFNFDMGTPTHNITCNSCHAGGGAAQFGRENKPLDEVLKEKLGKDTFESLKARNDWFIRDIDIPVDGDLFGYSDYEVGAGYVGKPGLFNFARSGVNDTDCFMCHAKADADSKIYTEINGHVKRPIMPANPRVMVFKGMTSDNETIVISLGIPPAVGDKVGSDNKTVAKIDSAYYNSVPLSVLGALYGLSPKDIDNIRTNNGTWSKFFVYPNNANGATREVTRVVYFEHPESTTALDGGDVYVNGGAATFHEGGNSTGEVVYRSFAGYFFKYISTASLMGVDTDGDGVPLAYVRFVKEDGIWKPEVYYDLDEFSEGDNGTKVALPILENKDRLSKNYNYSVPTSLGDASHPYPNMSTPAEGANANRNWGYVCSYCHMAIVYEDGNFTSDNTTVPTYAWVTRKGILGLGAEIVKRGDVFSYDLHIGGNETGNLEPDAFVGVDFSNETQRQQAFGQMVTAKSVISLTYNGTKIPIGYDVHFDSEKGGMTCLSCHGEGTLSDEEKQYHPIHHDFLKGNDWGGHWDQSLDYNPSLKSCVDCHFGGSRELAAEVHTGKFGPDNNPLLHMEKVSCEVCHIPFKTHWTFRAFYDVLGYSYNFDNRILGYDFSSNSTIPLDEGNFTPGFGPFMPIAGYGAPQPFCIVRTDSGNDTVVPIYQVDFDPRQAALRYEQAAFGIWAVPSNSFPWAWAPVIINNGFRPDTPGGQKFMYRIADPLTLVTWYDKSTGKVLYTREIAAALDGAIDSNYVVDKKVPAYFMEGDRICVHTILGDSICDDNGDYLPEINTDDEYEAMKAAIADVLSREGVRNPEPVFYIWTAPFSIDHGVLPKEFALGAGTAINGNKVDCNACHDALNGRLPQANMSKINANEELSALIEKDSRGIKFFGLGRKIVTVPVPIPPKAYREAVRVFFNSPEDNNNDPIYGTMTIRVAEWDGSSFSLENKTTPVMYTTAGDILVNALTNGIDIDRHLVPIPVESSGIEGAAFAYPNEEKTWNMKIEGIKTKVETEALEDDEVPRRAIVVRLKNELPELLGFEHLADEIMSAGGSDLKEVFTPIIPSELIVKMEFKLSDLGVTEPDDLYINYAKIHKERISKAVSTGENVEYEVKYEVKDFEPHSISVKEAISKGWAAFDPSRGTLTIHTRAMAEEIPGEGELAFSIMRKLKPEAETTVTAGGGGGGCSVAPQTGAGSGLLNLGVLFSGLLGLFGFRRKRH